MIGSMSAKEGWRAVVTHARLSTIISSVLEYQKNHVILVTCIE